MTIQLKTLEETQAAGARLGQVLKKGDVVCLNGALGVGKTSFVAGVARGLDVGAGYRVTSPTFVYANIYPGRVPLYHIDLYRIENVTHLRNIGIEEMLGGDGVAVVEWFDMYPEIWKDDRLEVRMTANDHGIRSFDIQGFGKRGLQLSEDWKISR